MDTLKTIASKTVSVNTIPFSQSLNNLLQQLSVKLWSFSARRILSRLLSDNIGVGSLVRLGGETPNWGSNRRIDTALEAKYWVGHGPLCPPVPTPMDNNDSNFSSWDLPVS